MRPGWGVGLVTVLTLGACRERAPSAVEDAGPRAPSVAWQGPACERVMPADLLELALPGFTGKEERACPTCGPLCTFRSAAEPGITVSLTYDCQPRAPQTEVRELLAPTLNAGGVEVPALGRAAARRGPVPGMLQVVAWDDDTPCVLTVTWLGAGSERAVEVLRTALRATQPALLPPEAGAPDAPSDDGGLP
ncbi:hypothetical protein POL68_35745 [Stigmatella sp. ncwal1]|uniref:Lipoprotein n=1 Tax=Stigmatella ashevillensis TaxID=2995309 RepID=A0ABT5DLG7_9BACT|nr:hypothetical protein [Stigmatella ashevillena]MDC0713874.1 hypothetical protein [Stigmatella ashevillena]